MKSTARNQFPGTVSAVELAPVSAQVVIEVGSGIEIVATMTRASAERLKLKAGQAAIALVKASAVVVMTELDGHVLSARNLLAGTVARVERGAVSSIVALALPGGLEVVASVTNDAVDDLGLAAGQAATAVFKAYAVIVAVEA